MFTHLDTIDEKIFRYVASVPITRLDLIDDVTLPYVNDRRRVLLATVSWIKIHIYYSSTRSY